MEGVSRAKSKDCKQYEPLWLASEFKQLIGNFVVLFSFISVPTSFFCIVTKYQRPYGSCNISANLFHHKAAKHQVIHWRYCKWWLKDERNYKGGGSRFGREKSEQNYWTKLVISKISSRIWSWQRQIVISRWRFQWVQMPTKKSLRTCHLSYKNGVFVIHSRCLMTDQALRD